MFVVGLPVSAMLSALAEPLILTLFGNRWAGAVRAFAVLAFVIPTQLLQRISLVMMHSLGRPGAGVKTHSLFLALALAGSVIGVSNGPEGVAVAVLAASTAGALVSFTMAATHVRLPLSTLWLALIKGGVLAIAVFASCTILVETFARTDSIRQLAVTAPVVAAALVLAWLAGGRWLFSAPAMDLITQALRAAGARLRLASGRLSIPG
jgi:O-antigen/teichoic acid export membrane protein